MKIDLAKRSRISNFISLHENAFRKATGGLWTFVGVTVIAHAFGFSTLLSSLFIRLLITAAGVFVPQSAVALMLSVYLVLQVMSLSQSVGGMLFLMLLLFYAFCYAYRAKHMNLLPGITVLYRLSIPYTAPLMAGLFGDYHETVTVISGSVVAYFLKSVHDSIPVISDGATEVDGFDILSEMIGSSGFYFFMAGMIVLFLVTEAVRNLRNTYAWVLSVVLGVLAETLVMAGGQIFFGQGPGIVRILGGNAVTAAVGFVAAYFFQNLDYSRVERVQFEDDDYYYYVTAVPKIHIADEDKEIKQITPDRMPEQTADTDEGKEMRA